MLAETTWRCNVNHSVEVLPAINRLLDAAGTARADLQAIFVCRGPGSYGGLRAGLSLAMSLAFALGIDVLGVGRFEVEAYQQAAFPGPICPVHRAGRGELAWAAYKGTVGDVRELIPPRLASPDDLALELPSDALVCGEVDAALADVLSRAGKSVVFASESASVRRAGPLAALGWHRYAAGERAAGSFIEPIYLREPNITKPKPRPVQR